MTYTTELRERELHALQITYKNFADFQTDVVTDLMGFECTPQQLDIGKFIAYGPKYRMVQAQRGESKTTITSIYAVWRLIHNPKARILIISAGSDLAMEIANWVIQIINGMPELACLRPDTSAGDRSSVKAFDVHHALKGAEKSPSVACIGITSNLAGRRADVLIADDVESTKNSQSAVQRERLAHLTRDFISICSKGDIIYLGTPQNTDSIYNGLPGRGFTIRVYPGRFPTPEELANYGPHLAPWILKQMLADPTLQTGGGPCGTRGKPTDPILLDEELLTAKEIDQGPAYFQLQHMLDTRLTDADRYPLKAHNLMFMDIPRDRGPITIDWARSEAYRIPVPQGFPVQESYYAVQNTSGEFGAFQGTHMYVDPAGGGKNGDEVGYAVTKFLAGYVFLVDAGGFPGGFSQKTLDNLTSVAEHWKPNIIQVEENFGKGAFLKIWQPHLLKKHRCTIEEVWESGQKELRIIDVLDPVVNFNRLIVSKDLIQKDWAAVQRYPAEQRVTYSLFFQLARITRERGALMHDDRLDAVAGSVRYWANSLAKDRAKVEKQIKEANWRAMMENPLGNGRSIYDVIRPRRPSSMKKFKRRF